MRSEKEIKAHIEYLYTATDRTDLKQLRELNIRMSELVWVLDKENSSNNSKKEK